MFDWPKRLAELTEAGTPCVAVTVAGVRGSAPRETGSKMLVTADVVLGTIGGGQLEHSCIAAARERLAKTGTPAQALRRFALGSQCGQCCGGVVDVLFERVDADDEWVEAAYATLRAGARAALVTHLSHRESRSDSNRHRDSRSNTNRRRDSRSNTNRRRESRSSTNRHRESRSDAAISQTVRQTQEIATPATRARNDGGASTRARNDGGATARARNDEKQVITAARIHALSPMTPDTDATLTEPAVLRALRAAVATPGEAAVVRLCGETLLVEPIGPPPLTVVIFGAGHVGRACATVLSTLNAAVFVVDSRPEQLQGDWPEAVTPAFIANPAEFVAHCPPHSCYLVMTHDHGLDLDLCREILGRPDRRFTGLIGSASKRRRFVKRLRAAGYDDETLESLTCPIGIDAITGKHPGEIAVAVAAQLVTFAQAAMTAEASHASGNVTTLHAPQGHGTT
ncbi:MAG: xanthine dehydrogenase accessory protein XdhC [Pseudomonadota bacterium]